MKTLYESILGSTSSKISDTKRISGAFGTKYVITDFGFYDSAAGYVNDGHIDIDVLNRLTRGMSYINVGDTETMRRLDYALDHPYNDYAREVEPGIREMKKVLMLIENSQLPDEDWLVGYHKDWGGLAKFLIDIFKPLTKDNIDVRYSMQHTDVFFVEFTVKLDKRRRPTALFYMKIRKPSVTEK